MVLTGGTEAELPDWIQLDSRLYAISRSSRGRNLLVISAYPLGDCSPDKINDTFYQKLNDLLSTVKRNNNVTLARDMNIRVGRLSSNEDYLRTSFGLDFCSFINGGQSLVLCLDNRLFLASANFRRSNRRYATWGPLFSDRRWTQTNHIPVTHK